MTTGRHRLGAALVAGLAATGLAIGTAATASAAQNEVQVECAGQPLTVLVAQGNDGDNWGAARVVDGGTLILGSLEFTVYDDTAGVVLNDEVISHGAAHANQQAIRCIVETGTFLVGDGAPDGFVYPPGTAPTDTATFTASMTVVPVL